MVLALPIAAPLAPSSATAGAPPARTFGATLRTHAAAPPTSPRAAASASAPARAALEAVDGARRSLDAALAAARNGRTFTAQELLAIQAQAYRYSQLVDVASKIVEQGAQSVKQAVNTQV